jgi:hypothetical protein
MKWIIAALAVVLPCGALATTECAFVTTTDFITGSSSRVDYCAPYDNANNVQSIHSDAVSRYFDELVYVVNRFGADNIQILDPCNNFVTVRQFSVGGGSDPHDILVLSATKAYVTRYNSTELWIVDPSTGVHTGSIDFSGLNDIDGIPEMDRMVRVDDRVFVTVQRLDRNQFYTPVGLSYVVVIDIASDTIVDVDPAAAGVQSITLTGTNPFSEIQLNPVTGRLFVACVGFFGVLDGGVEVINPVTLQSEGFIYTEATVGGDISDVEIARSDKCYAIYSDASFNTVLKSFDPQTGSTLATVYTPGGFVLNDIELSPKDELWVTDQTAVLPGIRIFDVTTDAQITTNPIDVGLPPFDITFIIPTVTGIRGDIPLQTTLGANYPNPFNPSTVIPFSIEKAGRVQLAVYDATGRRVRTLVDEHRGANDYSIEWDGRDDGSRPVGSGVYFVRLVANGTTQTTKVTLLK